MAWHIRKYPIHAQDMPKLFTDYPGQKKKKLEEKKATVYAYVMFNVVLTEKAVS